MSFGADVSAPQLKADAAQYGAQLLAFLRRFETWAQRINDVGPEAIVAAYASLSAPEAAGDAQDLQAFIGAIGIILEYATGQGPTGLPLASDGQTVTDNTAIGSTEQSVSVPAGAKAYVVTDAATMAQHDSVGQDKGPIIRKAAPLNAL